MPSSRSAHCILRRHPRQACRRGRTERPEPSVCSSPALSSVCSWWSCSPVVIAMPRRPNPPVWEPGPVNRAGPSSRVSRHHRRIRWLPWETYDCLSAAVIWWTRIAGSKRAVRATARRAQRKRQSRSPTFARRTRSRRTKTSSLSSASVPLVGAPRSSKRRHTWELFGVTRSGLRLARRSSGTSPTTTPWSKSACRRQFFWGKRSPKNWSRSSAPTTRSPRPVSTLRLDGSTRRLVRRWRCLRSRAASIWRCGFSTSRSSVSRSRLSF